MNNSLAARALAAAAIALVILVPIQLIKGKVGERQARADGVIKQFANETGRAQVVAGPFLAITCDEDCPILYFTPKELKASATLAVETVHRGIYPIRVYNADVTLSGEFEWPALPPETQARKWKHGYLVVAVSDARGIKLVKSSLPGPSSPPDESTLSHFAIREDLGQAGNRKAGATLPFSYRLSLLGTTSLQVLPIGDETEIRMGSGWPHPSFSEAWSPSERRVTRDGFEATWRITGLATGGRAKWQDVARSRAVTDTAGAGVTLFDPVNIYSLSYRATEYAFLFILFTFGALALTEAIAGVRLHPVQYALTGSAIAIFFLLLLALSEHVSFSQAYAIAAGACIALLTYYLRHPLGTGARTATFFALFVTLYGSLYGLLKSEDNALLMGSLMVFALLAFTMIATRKMDWGAIAARSAPQG
jgi:inner membrane protein